eukprot:18781-Eustigmatos_ZCMA.PRE.1
MCHTAMSLHRYQMRIHKRLIDLQAPADAVKHITTVTIEPGETQMRICITCAVEARVCACACRGTACMWVCEVE